MKNNLHTKYQVAAPRYTSYPTVPYWENQHFSHHKWAGSVVSAFHEHNPEEGLSLYIHLPYCESLCTYCGCNTRITKNHGVEMPYIQALLKEWQLYLNLFVHRPLIKELHLGGGTPTFFSPQNLKMLLDGILAYAHLHTDAEFSFEAHPANTTTAHLETLYVLGFKRLSLGIQDFDPVVQLAINRIQTYEQVEDITVKAREIGYTSINYDLIYDLPHQNINGLSDTIAAVFKLKPDRIAFYSYAHVPWLRKSQRRYSDEDLPDATLKTQLHAMVCKKLKHGGYFDIGMDHFTLPTDRLYKAGQRNTLHRNFMGYTHQYSKLLIGLGVSAISDTWFAFAQNEKKVEDYIRLLNEGVIPVSRGHMLTHEDTVIRQHILNIMCKGYTSWSAAEAQCEGLQEGLDRVRWMVQDGLVILSEQELRVTSLGKCYLRNICMALDVRYWTNQPKAPLFSLSV